jgi:ribosomal protein S24E
MHVDSGTPDRFSVRKALASKAGSKLDNVYVLDILNDTGTNRSSGRADVYENRQVAEKTLPKHLLVRNMSPEDRAKVQKTEKEKKTEAKKPAEEKKPAEKKTEEKKTEAKKEDKPPAEKPAKEAKKA